MSKMKKEDLDKIISRDIPGYRVAKKKSKPLTDSKKARQQPDAGTPELQEIRQKYRGRKRGSSDTAASAARDGKATTVDDDEIVAVEPENPEDPSDRGAQRKTVVISGRDKRIVGKQG